MSLKSLSEIMLPAIEAELQHVVSDLDQPSTSLFHEMLTYHMGWTGEGSGPDAQGKRIRPLLVLLTSSACSPGWQSSLPAAAAVELIHNFSLVHDDIQDNSELRRGRMTVWKKWGSAQAINAGDGLFVLANLSITNLDGDFPVETILRVAKILQNTCLNLTRGQFLDISFENRTNLVSEDYWLMISGKTAALLSASTQIGACLGGSDKMAIESYRDFGHYLGLAFQVQDDYLGIWGDSILTGKSVNSDLVAGKKTLPVLYGLKNNSTFAQRWYRGAIREDETQELARELEEEGAKLFTQQTADQLTDLALQSLRAAEPKGESGAALYELANNLLNRQS